MKQLFLFITLSLGISVLAQNNTTKEILFTVDGKPYFTDEFERVYKKNLDLVKDDSQKELDQYFDLFIGYKLKINKAYKLGLQNGTQYQNELKSNREQLSKKFLSDTKVTKELVQEAYNRMLKEIKASHILLTVDENAAPEDTLKVYNQILDIRKRAMNGESFGDLAVNLSQDPSAKENKGDLGYFTVFKMLYDFESEAYKTASGQVSKPVRTRFGYHIIKVEDIRDNRGEVTVAHIMIMNPKVKEDMAENEKVKNTIFDIYKKLQQGEKFEDLAKQFSEDKSSANKGGILKKFGTGQLSSNEFENVAFSLSKELPISEPFQTEFGWHIVKFIDKHPVKSFDKLQLDIENKVSRDDRSRLIAASMTEKLRNKYKVKRDDKLYLKLSKAVNNDFYKEKWELPKDLKPYENSLFSINNSKFKGTDFLSFVKAQQKSGAAVKPITKLVDNLYRKYVDEQLNVYYKDNLENEVPEFSAVMDEYRDGLLLFDLMEKEIWEKSKKDSIGLKKFYDNNFKNYQWKNRYDLVLISSTKQDIAKKASKLLKQDKTADFIKDKLNVKGGEVNVMVKEGIFEYDNEALPKNIDSKLGVSDVFKQGDYYYVTKINKIIPEAPKTMEECKGKLINDYQQFLESNWVNELKNEFKVEVFKPVYEKVKNKLKV